MFLEKSEKGSNIKGDKRANKRKSKKTKWIDHTGYSGIEKVYRGVPKKTFDIMYGGKIKINIIKKK